MSTIPPDFPKSAGPFLLGYLFNYGLYGVLTVQMYIYYNAFPNDRTVIQVLVYGLYIVETGQTILITWDAFQDFVYGFGDPGTLREIRLLWLDTCLIDGLVAFVVQTFYAYRIYLLSKSKSLMGVILFLAFLPLGGAIATATVAKIEGQFPDQHTLQNLVVAGVWLGGSAACDIVIATSMAYVLSRYDVEFKDTKDLVKRVIRLTVETGALTATVATVQLILALTFPYTPYNVTAVLMLAKVYSNSLMVSLNSRVKILGGREESTLKDTEMFDSGGERVYNVVVSNLFELASLRPLILRPRFEAR
ncbi:hypothetical protein L218DRAFT_1081842 [Marasmius fiardii PR-910]|nr:hypothetical protein L218DRAFT_1081842 [Marasmius fiardii PR-910]